MVILEWEVTTSDAGVVTSPTELSAQDSTWFPAEVPGTAASAMRRAGEWTDDDVIDFDSGDWWFRTSFPSAATTGRLKFGGIATIATVWLNDELVLHSSNMFHRHELDVSFMPENDLVVVCRSLRAHLAERRPRGRWKTRLVEMQQLRWARTTMLGRIPGWTVPAAPVGLWRPVEVIVGAPIQIRTQRLEARLDGVTGIVTFEGSLTASASPGSAQLLLGDSSVDLAVEADGAGAWKLSGRLDVQNPELWFPATHGDAKLHDVTVAVAVDGESHAFPVGPVGFRTVEVDEHDGRFAVSINGVDVFCRGACWTPVDVVRLSASEPELRDVLRLVVAAGMNMIRVTGTMVYEQPDFYHLCDEMGILIWHDFMFANLDYPIDDEAFATSVETEVEQFLADVAHHPSLVILCGGSEVEQQAAMMGFKPSEFTNDLGRRVLSSMVSTLEAQVHYVPCSPIGGVFPFSVSTGVSHYYGVGAYMRPLTDARRSGVKFASECLAFSNVPCRESLDDFLRDGERPTHSPRWKARVPRDRGAGWDFDDVRDHYVQTIFGVDPSVVRYADPDRYLDVSRAATCVAVESTLNEFRRAGSPCRGALLLLLRDLWDGAGWGIIDVRGRPKSTYYAVARASAPLAVFVIDEGLDGLIGHFANDTANDFHGTVRVRLFDAAGTSIATGIQPAHIAARATKTVVLESVFEGFRDINHAYRFGPAVYDSMSIELIDPDGIVRADSCHLPLGHERPLEHAIGLQATAVPTPTGLDVTVRTEKLAQFVSIDIAGHVPDQNWFHLAPHSERTVMCRTTGEVSLIMGEVRALNARGSRPLKIETVGAS